MIVTMQKWFLAFQRRFPQLAKFLYATRKATWPFRRALFRLSGKTRYPWRLYSPSLAAAVGKPDRESEHMRDHLGTLFCCAIEAKPRLIVELGTRGGDSTCALLAAAHVSGARLLSVDIDDCGTLDLPYMAHWRFIKADDITFGLSGFAEWCRREGLSPEIDLLFIDTSHAYDHTKREIQVWEPLLSASGTMIFHDTNMGGGVYGRTDGSVGIGWNNRRGVIRAVEEFLGRAYDETAYFCDLTGGYLVTHHPSCSGLTVLKKCGLTDAGPDRTDVVGTH